MFNEKGYLNQQLRLFNSKDELITLNAKEKRTCDHYQRIMNSLGYEINITSLTTIMKKINK